MTQILKALLVFTCISIGLTGCVYHIDVQQGNVITDKDLTKIHNGMPIQRVVKILGEPLLQNVYKDNRMVYVYTMKRGHRPMTRRVLNIYVKNGRVVHYTTSFSKVSNHKRNRQHP